jgi:DNA helicase-2/ATP-dependent DNA helicase PcrA
MLSRLSALTPVNTRGMWIGTFHGLCNRMLRMHYRDAGLPQLFQIMDTQDQLALIKRVYKAHNIDDERFPARQLQSMLNAAKEEGLRPNQVEANAGTRRRVGTMRYTSRRASARRGRYELLLRNTSCSPQRRPREHRGASRASSDQVQGQRSTVQRLRRCGGIRYGAVRGWRRRPVDLSFPAAPRHNMQHHRRDWRSVRPLKPSSSAELPLARTHPRRRQRADRPNQTRLGKNLWTADACTSRRVHRAVGPRRGGFHRKRHQEWRATTSHRQIAVLYQSTQSRWSARAGQRRHPYRVYGGMRFSSAPRSSTRWRICDWSPAATTWRVPARGQLSAARGRRPHAGGPADRAQGPGRACGRRHAPARPAGAGSSVAAFVRQIRAMRVAIDGLSLASRSST